MSRYKITIEYDGTNYAGWQQQKGATSIQEELQKALFAFTGQNILIFGAGRTDSGVHASGQVAHFDLDKEMESYSMCQAFNAHLRPQPISVIASEKVDDTFNARTNAKLRTYEYVLLNRRFRPALLMNKVWWVPFPLDVEKMKKAAECLVGNHDFTTFRAKACQAKSPVRTLDSLLISQKDDLIVFEAKARSFLHHQVRNIVGTLKLVGEGLWEVERVKEALAAKDRSKGGPTAPPEGLYFKSIQF